MTLDEADLLAHVERWIRARVTVDDVIGRELSALLAEYDRRGDAIKRVRAEAERLFRSDHEATADTAATILAALDEETPA